MNQFVKILFLSFCLASSVASASSVSIVQSNPVNAVIGDTVTFDLILDATGYDQGLPRGSKPPIRVKFDTDIPSFYNGSLTVGYDSASLSYESLSPQDSLIFDISNSPDGSLTFSFDNLGSSTQGIKQGTIGSLQFRALAAGNTTIAIEDANPLGSFVQQITGGSTVFYPELNGTSFDVAVPVPAAFWLMLTGLGMLFGSKKVRRSQLMVTETMYLALRSLLMQGFFFLAS